MIDKHKRILNWVDRYKYNLLYSYDMGYYNKQIIPCIPNANMWNYQFMQCEGVTMKKYEKYSNNVKELIYERKNRNSKA